MYISAISINNSNNSCLNNVKRNNTTQFKGGYNENMNHEMLNMLLPKVSSIMTGSTIEDLTPIVDSISRKWNATPYSTSIGIKAIPDKYLAGFLGKDVSKFDIKNSRGFCIAIGDVYGPMEGWNKCYEAVTVILPKLKK